MGRWRRRLGSSKIEEIWHPPTQARGQVAAVSPFPAWLGKPKPAKRPFYGVFA
jgi:hypothetical protein